MDMRTEGVDARERVARASARGRRDNQGQEAVIKPEPLKKALKDLGHLKTKAEEAKTKLREAVKAVAEKSGLESSVVNRLVNARHAGSEKFDTMRRRIEQEQFVFSEIGFTGEISAAVDSKD